MEAKKNSYDSFNARYLSFDDVAATFIKNSQFEDLLSNSHSVVMGPRGCGKTTLLKMLYPQALFSWKSDDAKTVIEKIPFWAIYIPTDSQWSSQLAYMHERFAGYPEVSQCVSNSLVCINVLTALCNCFRDLINIYDGDDAFDKETELAAELINVWELKRPITPSLYAILQSLNKEVQDIDMWVKRNYADPQNVNFKDAPNYFYKDFLTQITIGCDAFKEIFKNNKLLNQKKFKWALCFDELEIAPEWLRKKIFSEYLRSKNQQIIFKVTSTPFMDWDDVFDKDSVANNIPSKENDYNIIRTWVFDTNTGDDWNVFCDKLTRNILFKNINLNIHPEELFGMYDIIKALEVDEPSLKSQTNKDYIKDSSSWRLFVKLAEKDSSFKRYLEKNSIDPQDPECPEKEDAILRKIKPIAAFRYYFMKSESEFRTRKSANVYFGLPFIYELSEGNPRTAINMINSFVSIINKENPSQFIPIIKQSKIINDFSVERLDYYNNYPNTTIGQIGVKDISLGDFINKIGVYFKDELFSPTFKPEPVNCFVVDKKTNPTFLKLVSLALNLGAIQYIDPKDEITKDGLYGKKFKLSYILYPSFSLPKRVNKHISLSSIIESRLDTQETLNLFSNESK